MFSALAISMPLSAADRVDRMMDAFRATRGDYNLNQSWTGLLIFLAVAAFIALVVMVIKSYWRQWNASSPRILFMQICRAQKLKWPQRILLWRLAQSQNLAEPASLFLRPECFEIGRLTVEMRPYREELQILKEVLFSEPSHEKNLGSGNGGFFKTELSNFALPVSQVPPTLDLPQWNADSGIGVE
jgi:hypothetical protein